MVPSLLQLGARNVDEQLALGLIRDDELGELRAAVADWIEALGEQVLLREVRRLYDRGEFRVELVDDRRRRSLRRKHPEPGFESGLVRRQSGLAERGHVGNEWIAARSRNQEALDLAFVDLPRDIGIPNDEIEQLDI